MGLQSRQKQGPFALLQEHGSGRGKVIQHDHSGNMSHTTYWF